MIDGAIRAWWQHHVFSVCLPRS